MRASPCMWGRGGEAVAGGSRLAPPPSLVAGCMADVAAADDGALLGTPHICCPKPQTLNSHLSPQ